MIQDTNRLGQEAYEIFSIERGLEDDWSDLSEREQQAWITAATEMYQRGLAAGTKRRVNGAPAAPRFSPQGPGPFSITCEAPPATTPDGLTILRERSIAGFLTEEHALQALDQLLAEGSFSRRGLRIRQIEIVYPAAESTSSPMPPESPRGTA